MRRAPTDVSRLPYILHVEITLLPYEKETQLLLRLGTTIKITKPPKQRRAFLWEFAMSLGVRLETG